MPEQASTADSAPGQMSPEARARLILKADEANLAKKVQQGKTLSASERRRLESVLFGTGQTFAANQEELAEALDVSRKTIQRALQRPGNPGHEADGRLSVAAWRAFLSTTNPHLDEESPKETASRQRARNILLKNDKLEFELDVLRKRFVATEDVERWVGELIGEAKKVLLSGPAMLAPQVVGETIPNAERIIRDWVHHALTQLHRQPTGAPDPETLLEGNEPS